ncbi:hypothetical protein LOZ66_003011 [Ophidiomyces ophidiicola]|nr:hypothetical protein LOZ66_003011 [Ophidiomyces ophidiicola]
MHLVVARPSSHAVRLAQSRASHAALESITAGTLRYHPRQQRSFIWRGCSDHSNWDKRAEAHLQKHIDKTHRISIFKRFYLLHQQKERYHSRRGSIWNIPKYSSFSCHRTTSSNKQSRWGWDQSTLEKQLAHERSRFKREYGELKRQIEEDPYGMIFGRRLTHRYPFSLGQKSNTFGFFYRRRFGVDRVAQNQCSAISKQSSDQSHTAGNNSSHPQGSSSSETTLDNDAIFQFDPISRRMVPRDDSKSNSTGTSEDAIDIRVRTSYSSIGDASPISQEAEKSFQDSKAHNKLLNSSSEGTCGQRRIDGVWLMGSPQADGIKAFDNPPTQDGHVRILNEEVDHIGCQPKQLTSRKHPLFTRFKDYLTAKFDTYNHERAAKVKRNQEMAGDALRSELTNPHSIVYTDPERLNIESLRTRDVRSSFEARKSNLEAQKSESTQNTATLDRHPDVVIDKGHVAAPNHARNIKDIQEEDRRLVEGIRAIYEETCGRITPMHRQCQEDVGKREIESNTNVEKQNNISSFNKLERVVWELERTNSAIWNSLRKFEKTQISNHSANLHSPVKYGPAAFGLSPTSLMESQGYEMVSEMGDVLIFRKKKVDVVGPEMKYPQSQQPCADDSTNDPKNNNNHSFGPSTTTPEVNTNTSTETAPKAPFEEDKSKAKLESTEWEPTIPDDTMPGSNTAYGHAFSHSVHSLGSAAQLEQDSIIKDFEEHKTSGSTDPHPPETPITVRRQETHYTGGPPNWFPYQPGVESQPSPSPPSASPPPHESSASGEKRGIWSSLWKTLRRMLLTGAAAGGSCYALGVVAEYFRTGGQDGLGPRGFTGLGGR